MLLVCLEFTFDFDLCLVASLRLGGEPRTSDDHVVLIGDAAGMIDPMTGKCLSLSLGLSPLSFNHFCAEFQLEFRFCEWHLGYFQHASLSLFFSVS